MVTSPASLLRDITAFVAATKEPTSADKPVRLATVDSGYTSGWPQVTFDGETTLSGKAYPHVDSYAPAAGDRVVLVPVGTTYLIVGAVSSTGAGLPAGSIVEFGGASAPGGWLACDGSAVSRTTYARLYAAIGTTWGIGDGSTTFNLPDFRGRSPLGTGTGAGLTARSLADTGGAETVQLTSAELAAHTHTGSSLTVSTITGHTHTQQGSTTSDNSHSHTTGLPSAGPGGVVATGGTSYAQVGSGSTGTAAAHSHTMQGSTGVGGSHAHTLSGSTGSAGSDTAHENMMPFTAVPFIIKI